MFKELVYTGFNSEEITDLIKVINEEPSELNQFLLFNLEVINESIEQLSTDKAKLIELSAVRQLVKTLYLAKKIESIFSERSEEIKITSSETESIKINAEAIVNGVEKVAELHKKNMLEVPSAVLIVYLTTWNIGA